MINEQLTQKPKVNFLFLAVKIDRLAAWILLIVVILYAITGYGMTKGIIDSRLASSLHLGWLGLVGLLAFVIHTSWAIHLALRRKCIWNNFSKIILASFYIILILFFVYIHFFYSLTPNNKLGQGQTNSNYSTNNSTNTSGQIVSTKANPSVFTAQTLSQYNGLNGQSAYVAVDGLVYDMSNVFKNGQHHGYTAGQDLSAAFHGQHPDSFLNSYEVVGSYK